MTCASRIFRACAVLTRNGNFCVVQPNTVCRISHHFGPTGISALTVRRCFRWHLQARGPRAERDPPSRLSRVAPWPQLAASLNAAALSPPKHTLVSGGRWLGGHGTLEPA